MISSLLLTWLVSAMASWVPPSTDADVWRYREIASDVLAESDTANEAVILLSIASLESGYRADIDSCAVRGDHGVAVSLWQIHAFGAERVEVCADRRAAIRFALRHVRWSLRACGGLSGYTAGRCTPGEPKALARLERARRWMR